MDDFLSVDLQDLCLGISLLAHLRRHPLLMSSHVSLTLIGPIPSLLIYLNGHQYSDPLHMI